MPNNRGPQGSESERALAKANAAHDARQQREEEAEERRQAGLIDSTTKDAAMLMEYIHGLRAQKMPRGSSVSLKPKVRLSSALTLTIKPRPHETEARKINVAAAALLVRVENAMFSLEDDTQRLLFDGRGGRLRLVQRSEADRGVKAKRRTGKSVTRGPIRISR